MNCKPGDLAVIVAPDTSTRNLGKIVRVLHGSRLGDGWWWVESLSPAFMNGPGSCDRVAMEGNIEDRRLRPIRDPGDDAVDETLLWLPAPTTETA